MQKIYDISLPISESLAVWPGDPAFEMKYFSHQAQGDICTTSQIIMGAHAGTHVDAPKHFIPTGGGIEGLDLNVLVGTAQVVEALEGDAINESVLESLDIPEGVERILFRTRNSEFWKTSMSEFQKDFVAITEDGAQWLVQRGIRLVGIDYLSVAPFDAGAPTHHVLLSAGIIALEGIDLREVNPGTYQLMCLPLKIMGGDGAPARAILVEES